MLEIFPAIDLQNGQAVRLYKGDMRSATIYGDPCGFAKRFEQDGAKWVHIVDLDGALSGKSENLAAIESIRKNTKLLLQLGGGIRDEESIKRYLDLGIDRLILGSLAANSPELARSLAEKYPIAVGIDAINGKVAINGWVESSSIDALDLARFYQGSRVQALICTDIGRDGALSGVNVDFSVAMGEASGLPIIASGGLKDAQDIASLSQAFIAHNLRGGVIIGKALYEQRIDLPEAFIQAQRK
ncbi:1-(5-phosphoribosyl)-5-[(5-phosphoribosylamino)methylideneamino]imidazole-4-carboxamide isomerase [Helicobacter canis NCTC 12740]|uniref:1-(5-phosphoribosyl)-5-[(5-phosphoribosylamino)methylideneamino] imidazole-4-carboxamide isomerase n=1 Tax=Helicobacter canis NCTC 12740 TaxID=1357399 RepID=V8CJT2_9HELI|nr:1-(5-phosphoribosyl)-5-[(5-phosphoribosylamino)methylideneamino]imidazole-4-carboxamide isomerase [Helicobacter canis NCTC 12740]